MSILDDLGQWAGNLFSSGSAADTGSAASDAASSYYDTGGDALAGSVGSGASSLGDTMGSTSPSIDSLLAQFGNNSSATPDAASGAASVGTAPSIDSVMRRDGIDNGSGFSGLPQVAGSMSHTGVAAATKANDSDSWLQKLMKGDPATSKQAQMGLMSIGLLQSLLHRTPSAPTAPVSAFNAFTPGQQTSFNTWANAAPHVYVPPTYGHKNGGHIGRSGGLASLDYADGGMIPGAQGGPMQGGPQVMPMAPGAGPAQGGGGPLQQFAASHPNFNADGAHPQFAQSHPNFMANHFPGYGGPAGGSGGGINPGGPMIGGGINPGMPTGFNGGTMPGAPSMGAGAGMAMPGSMPAYAEGGDVPMGPPGAAPGAMPGDPSQGGPFAGYVQGSDPGQSDLVPIRVSPGEYVFDADSVAALGDGNNAAGAALLDRMREQIRQAKRAAPPDSIPPPLAQLAQQPQPQGQ